MLSTPRRFNSEQLVAMLSMAKVLIEIDGLHCPHCGSGLDLCEATTFETYHPGYHVKGTPLPTRPKETIIAACVGCEFVLDLAEAVL